MIEGIVGVVLAFALVAIVDYATRGRSSTRRVKVADGHTVRIRTPHNPADRADSLLRLRAEWLADDRPAFETVDAFERNVEAILQGKVPARGDRVPAKPADVALVRQAKAREIRRMAQRYGRSADWTDPQRAARCAHRDWDGDTCRSCGDTVPF